MFENKDCNGSNVKYYKKKNILKFWTATNVVIAALEMFTIYIGGLKGPKLLKYLRRFYYEPVQLVVMTTSN